VTPPGHVKVEAHVRGLANGLPRDVSSVSVDASQEITRDEVGAALDVSRETFGTRGSEAFLREGEKFHVKRPGRAVQEISIERKTFHVKLLRLGVQLWTPVGSRAGRDSEHGNG
jgi:hypothetical protein